MSVLKRFFRLSPLCCGTTCRGFNEYFPDYFDFTRHICPGNTR